MKRSDLFEEYARVIRMCEDEVGGVSSYMCVKVDGSITRILNPSFLDLTSRYEFARYIIEGKPAFDGDIVYDKDGRKQVIGLCGLNHDFYWRREYIKTLTWSKPVKVATDRLSFEEKEILRFIYKKLWCEGCYDPTTKETEAICSELAASMSRLNDTLKFLS